MPHEDRVTRAAVDALVGVADQEQVVGVLVAGQGADEAQGLGGHVLGLVDDDGVRSARDVVPARRGGSRARRRIVSRPRAMPRSARRRSEFLERRPHLAPLGSPESLTPRPTRLALQVLLEPAQALGLTTSRHSAL
jgi:hypothetical protein